MFFNNNADRLQFCSLGHKLTVYMLFNLFTDLGDKTHSLDTLGRGHFFILEIGIGGCNPISCTFFFLESYVIALPIDHLVLSGILAWF